MPSGFGPVVAGAATVFFAVFGYDAMSTAAEEAKDGKKHMPKAIIMSLIIAMLLYVAATLVLTGMQNYQEIDPKAGFASAFNSVGLPVIATIISVFAVLSILTVMLTFLLGVTRVWFSMSRDGLLPGWFCQDGPATARRSASPGSPASAPPCWPACSRSRPSPTSPTSASWPRSSSSASSVIVFRYKKPDAPRTFRLPLMPLVPAFGVLASAFLMLQLHWETWVRFGVWLDHRPDHLLRLRPQALPDEPGQPAARGARGDAPPPRASRAHPRCAITYGSHSRRFGSQK